MSFDEIEVQIKKLQNGEGIQLPRYMTENSAGMDIFAAVEKEVIVMPGGRDLIPTGIAIALPHGYEAQIRPRSGLAIKNGITILNSPGTIDEDYRGEIKIVVINHGDEPFTIKKDDRIAQMIVQRVCRVSWNPATDLNATKRNDGGFGHTGQ
jgi:dUTP pyrophosphatase